MGGYGFGDKYGNAGGRGVVIPMGRIELLFAGGKANETGSAGNAGRSYDRGEE